MNEMNDLSKWIYYTGLFLSDFNQKKDTDESSKKIFTDFLKNNGFTENTNFYLWNQGTILILLYGLFVLPKEFWTRFLSDDSANLKTQADNLIFDNFSFTSREHFIDCDNIDSKKLDKETFLRRFRNAISHNRIEIIKGEQAEIKFTNKPDRPDNAPNNFAVKISPQNLTGFLNEISKFFIDNLK